jgi:chromate transporter
VSLAKLGLFFLKVGAVLYGTGYVLFAYLEGDLVGRYDWLSHDQLLDAIAIGQFTPGPILSTSTFIGYVLMAGEGDHMLGLAGAAVATAAVFLPSFVLVAITNPIIPKLRKGRWTASFLDAVNAASMCLMAAVTLKLAWRIFFPTAGWAALNWQALIITVVACLLTLRWKVNAVWLVLGGAAAGMLFWLVGLQG